MFRLLFNAQAIALLIKPGKSSCHGLNLQLLILQELLVYCCDFQLTTSGWFDMLGYFYYLVRIEV